MISAPPLKRRRASESSLASGDAESNLPVEQPSAKRSRAATDSGPIATPGPRVRSDAPTASCEYFLLCWFDELT